MNSSSTGIERRTENVSYKVGIYEAIAELKDRPGSSMIAIKRCMQVKLPNDQQWQNQVFLSMLKVAVAKGDLLQNENSYKFSAEYKLKAKKKAEKAASDAKKDIVPADEAVPP